MSLTVTPHYHAEVLSIKGRFLGSLERDALHQTLDGLRAAGHTRLVVDLSRTTFMDSTAVGLLIDGKKRLRQAGGDLRLGGMQQRVHGLFAMTRLLGPVFDDFETVEAALQSFAEVPAAQYRS